MNKIFFSTIGNLFLKLKEKFNIKNLRPNVLIQQNSFNRFIKIEDTIAGKPFEMYLREDAFIESGIKNTGLYSDWEKESLKIWAKLSKKSITILDIGANTGIYSMIAQNNNPAAKIIAIEPVKLNFEILRNNIKRNKFSILTEKVALSDTDGEAKMFMLKDRLNYMTSVNDNRYSRHPEIKKDYEVIEIQVKTKGFPYIYDKYNLSRIDLVKIDVEGYETAVIKSMLPYIEKHKPTILIEIIGDDNAEILTNIFKKIGYQFVSIDEKNLSFTVDQMWDNNHHNFLVCNMEVVDFLRKNELIK